MGKPNPLRDSIFGSTWKQNKENSKKENFDVFGKKMICLSCMVLCHAHLNLVK